MPTIQTPVELTYGDLSIIKVALEERMKVCKDHSESAENLELDTVGYWQEEYQKASRLFWKLMRTLPPT